MIRPTPTPHDIASESLRMAYEQRAKKPTDLSAGLGMEHTKLNAGLRKGEYPPPRRLISLGKILRAVEPYLEGSEEYERMAKDAGWSNWPTLSRSCYEATGRSPKQWRDVGADLLTILDAGTQGYASIRPAFLGCEQRKTKRTPPLPFSREWLERERAGYYRRRVLRRAGRLPSLERCYTKDNEGNLLRRGRG